jgi:hypothetical protein
MHPIKHLAMPRLFFIPKCPLAGLRKLHLDTVNEFKGMLIKFEEMIEAGSESRIVDVVNVSEFDQLRWIFDGEKVKELKKADFINELNKVTIPPEIIQKWTKSPGASQNDLIKLLENKFDTIFLIK